ncbi:putative HhH-GPD family protein [Kitasatospora sp. GP30]|uniref:HhH-GPD-type base excision DNA repair protein n=1 Tax=Kitasatospora sp. GP30 TaxID=3035084 RepID=UPI000C7000EC|nr:HhH-GPD-type base excision DNA repair protein [Kitasatospora sp. GP30]MDH6138167.1 putative HhH-GPD family protein [Kitasatospora sp. GP30]
MAVTLRLAQQADADALLSRSPLALMIGMLLDQQVPMELAFTGPYTVAQRMGVAELDAGTIANQDPEEFAALFAAKPAVHRYPGSMAGRVQQLCRFLVERYGGRAEAVWRDAPSGAELLRRLNELPGFGPQKSQIFLALLGKQLGVRPAGWREAAGAYGEDGSHRSVADITDAETLLQVRSYKQQMKQAAKAKKKAGS